MSIYDTKKGDVVRNVGVRKRLKKDLAEDYKDTNAQPVAMSFIPSEERRKDHGILSQKTTFSTSKPTANSVDDTEKIVAYSRTSSQCAR